MPEPLDQALAKTWALAGILSQAIGRRRAGCIGKEKALDWESGDLSSSPGLTSTSFVTLVRPYTSLGLFPFCVIRILGHVIYKTVLLEKLPGIDTASQPRVSNWQV